MGDVNYQAVRGVLRWESPDQDIHFTLSGDYTRDRRGNPAEVLAAVAPVNSPNTNNGGIPYDDRFICGPFCNYALFYAPPGNFEAAPLFFLDPPDNTIPFFIPGANGAPLGEYIGDNQTTYDGWNMSANLHWGVNDWIAIDNIFGYGEFHATFDTDADLAPTYLGVGNNDLTHWHWSEELRISLQPVDTVTIVLGGYYFEQSTTYFSYQDIRYVPIFPLLFQQPDVTDADSKAAFANVAWEIMPSLNLNAGVRYTEESKSYTYFRLNRDGTVNPFLDPIGAATGIGSPGALSGNAAIYDGDNIDYRVALDYRFSPEVMIYASIATGFKGGGTNPRPFNAFQAIGFGPEELVSYELGIRTDLLDDRLRLNVTGFISDYTDIQLGVSECPVADDAPPGSATPCAGRINGGDARYEGIEVELFAEPADGFNIDASLSYIDSRFTSLLPTAEFGPTNLGGIERDDPPGGTPKFKFNFGAQYEIDLGGSGTLTPRFDVEHTGQIYVGATRLRDPLVRDRAFLPSETLLNARITWMNEDEDLSISLEGRNLTDEYYYYTQFDLRTAGAGSNKAAVARPRELAITVRQNF